jgi:hypothetical protein
MYRDFPDNISHRLFTAWCEAEQAAHIILAEVEDDMSHPRYIAAEACSTKALQHFLQRPASSLYGILLKLKIACQFEDFVAEAIDPAGQLVTPRAVVAAMYDLENLLIVQVGNTSGEQETISPPAAPDDQQSHEA